MAAPPASIGCLACHGQFFAASLPIHQKTCFQRNAFVLVPCEKCRTCVRACDFHTHTTSCSGKTLPPNSGASGLSSGAIQQQNSLDARPLLDVNLPEADGRVRCKICERAFSQDRISKHQSVCRGKPRSTKENHERKQRSVNLVVPSHGNSSVKRSAERPRRKTVHTQRVLASRPQELPFDFVRERTNRGEWGNGGFRAASSRSVQGVRDPSQRQSCSYPGAQTMQSGGCDTSNASSASNPLVTNPLMAMRR
ncbi:hypothetical protein PRIC1_004277 [Phytophthora ramorum]